MHQDYSPQYVWEEMNGTSSPDEQRAGEIIVQRLLAGDKGHYGCLEHPQITLACGYFPHSVMQQLRTHRVGITFDVQSYRYSSGAVLEVAAGQRDIEDAFYVRPVGRYTDRHGKHYEYTPEHRSRDVGCLMVAVEAYATRIVQGMPEEQARGLLAFDYRQHFVMSCNARSLMHLLDLRAKADAQLECQRFCDLLFLRFQEWMPEIATWYFENRWKRARLAP